MASLGLGESNAKDYQVGVISLGQDPPELISSLRPIADARDALAKAISSPKAKPTTYLVPALQLAYRELKESPQRRPGNQPAVVLLTDGAPYPEEGQGDEEIRELIEANSDVPLFIILLQNPEKKSDTLERYTRFWEGAQRQYDYVRAYRANNASEITQTFDEIVARLQNSITEPGGDKVTPQQPLLVYVGKYDQKMELKIVHEPGKPKATVTIIDPKKVVVTKDDRGVVWFPGADNPTEAISIGAERLDQAPRNDIWTITSTAPVDVRITRRGAYHIEFVQPEVSLTSVASQYLALSRQSPAKPMTIRFKLLLNKNGEPVTERQEINGRVVRPDGTSAELRIPSSIQPDANGIYEITYDFVMDYPAAAKRPGRFMLTLNAGVSDPKSDTRVPIARADLLVDVGRGAYIASVAPEQIICAADQPPANLIVTLGDADAAKTDSIHTRVYYGGRDLELKPGSGNTFTAALAPVCQALLSGLACDQKREDKLRIRLVSENRDGSVAPPAEYSLAVQVAAVRCTPTPTRTPVPPTATPTPTLTPTPTPTPIPNSDPDPLNDLVDKCPTRAEWKIAPWFGGCPPPWWALVLGGLAGLAILALIVFILIPLLTVLISPPPDAYVLIIRDGKAQSSPRSIRNAGMGVLRNKVTIGSEGHIRIAGLKPIELRVERRGKKDAVVLDGATGSQKTAIHETPPAQLNTSNTSVILKFSTDATRLRP